MKTVFRSFLLSALAVLDLLPIGLHAAETVRLPAREKFHLFLLAGQSNMAGRGKVEPGDLQAHPRVWVWTRKGDWRPATDPLHWDKKVAGVGLGKTFAEVLADRDPGVAIGLIPAACGGSPIEAWRPGVLHHQTKTKPWDDALARTRQAMKQGTLQGILWHQGESDCNESRSQAYEARLTNLIARFRKEFGNPDLPFLIGEMGRFYHNSWPPGQRRVTAAQREVARTLNGVAFVASEGLTSKTDQVHFNAESYREFGRRYAEAYLKLRR